MAKRERDWQAIWLKRRDKVLKQRYGTETNMSDELETPSFYDSDECKKYTDEVEKTILAICDKKSRCRLSDLPKAIRMHPTYNVLDMAFEHIQRDEWDCRTSWRRKDYKMVLSFDINKGNGAVTREAI